MSFPQQFLRGLLRRRRTSVSDARRAYLMRVSCRRIIGRPATFDHDFVSGYGLRWLILRLYALNL